MRNGAMHCGAMCRNIILTCDAPIPRAASTYAVCFMLSATERITRAPNGTRVTAIATIIVHIPAPSTSTSANASIKPGSAIIISTNRWLIISVAPPK